MFKYVKFFEFRKNLQKKMQKWNASFFCLFFNFICLQQLFICSLILFACILQGRSAFSEPETRTVYRFISRRRNTIKAFLTFHSYSQILMYPFGHREQTYTSDTDDLVSYFAFWYTSCIDDLYVKSNINLTDMKKLCKSFFFINIAKSLKVIVVKLYL